MKILRACMVALFFIVGCNREQLSESPQTQRQELDPVVLDIDPQHPLFIGKWRRVEVTIPPSLGLQFDNLQFNIPDASSGSMVSASKDETFDAGHPSVVIGAGFKVGTHVLEVRDTNSNFVGSAEFAITDAPYLGQPGDGQLWFNGKSEPATLGEAWGGGSTTQPDNLAVFPRHGQHNVAVILIETSDATYGSTLAQQTKDDLADALRNGISVNGELFSTTNFMEETSENNYTIGDIDMFGPFAVNGTFLQFFTPKQLTDGGLQDKSDPKADTLQAAVSAADNQVDYTKYDSVVFVIRSTTGNYVWPQATIGSNITITNDKYNLLTNVSAVWLPNDYESRIARRLHDVVTHELFHNFGLVDQYAAPKYPGRLAENWDIMGINIGTPYATLGHRLMLDWVDAGTIRLVNFAATGALYDTIPIGASGLGSVDGLFDGIEVRISPGENYYIEYRSHNTGLAGDRSLPLGQAVIATDFISYPYVQADAGRPALLLLPNNGDGPILEDGETYSEYDYTSGGIGSPFLFSANAYGFSATDATVFLSYDVFGVDPYIRPWPASDERPWQSPDIEIINERTKADSQWFNTPWADHTNQIVATVHNDGDMDAWGVIVRFYVKNLTVANSAEQYLGFEQQDIPAKTSAEFSTIWFAGATGNPPRGHYCIVARIDNYYDPMFDTYELSNNNNVAESNYTRFISSTNSPSTREGTPIELQNNHQSNGTYKIQIGQSNPLYRTYVDKMDLHLDAGQTGKINLWSEYAGGPAGEDSPYRHRPNDITVRGLWVGDDSLDGGMESSFTVTGGAQLQFVEGNKTSCALSGLTQTDAGICFTGSVVRTKTGLPAPMGHAIVTMTSGKDTWSHTVSSLDGGACFSSPHASLIQLYYVPPEGWADCSTTKQSLP